MKSKVFKALGWAVLIVTALFFIMAGSQKLIGNEEMNALFQALGYPRWFQIAVGVLEIAGAIVLLIPRTTAYAALAMGALMIGAVVSELQIGDVSQALLPGQWVIVFFLIFYVKRRKRTLSSIDRKPL